MKTRTKEAEILEQAVRKFNRLGLNLTIERVEANVVGHKADAIVRLRGNGIDYRYIVEIKHRLTTATVGILINHLNQFNQKGLIVTDYVNPNLAERLKEKDIHFIDIAGNAYINEPKLFLFLTGNKPIKELPRRGKTRAFQPTGLKVLFAFLCMPELVNAPYREIAKRAQVALGTVGWILTDLREAGLLVEMGKHGRRLLNIKKLLNRWVEAYPENLRPKLIAGRGRYKADKNDWWKFTQIQVFNAYWGGEIAAAKLTEYLKPQIATIYTRDDPKELILKNKLFAHPQGNIEILDVFWAIEYENKWKHEDLVPPLLIYADLIATGDDRNLETARIIYEREIARYIRED